MTSPTPPPPASLQIKTFCLGQWMTNCHVLHTALSAECWIIDAGFDPQPLLQYIDDHNLTPTKIIMTHAHVDHMAGLNQVRAKHPDTPILIHDAEKDFLTDPTLNLSAMLATPITAPPPDSSLTHNQTLELQNLTFQVRHTPGHSPGGITLYQPDAAVAIVGDALFAGSIGRTDFPTSNHATLITSIQNQLMSLPDATRILPGHGPATTIATERQSNPFLQ